jgi:hypothetical protein
MGQIKFFQNQSWCFRVWTPTKIRLEESHLTKWDELVREGAERDELRRSMYGAIYINNHF